MKLIATFIAALTLTGPGACTFHAGIGGMGAVHGDGKTGDTTVSDGTFAATVGAGPCRRWPRWRASFTVEMAMRGASFVPFGAGETMWIFREGEALEGPRRTVRARRSVALKSRLAGGWNGLTDRWVAEAGVGLALLADVITNRNPGDGTPDFSGNFHAFSFDVIATYAPDRSGDGEVWLGGQITYHTNAFSIPTRAARRSPSQRYEAPMRGQSTDCNSGHLP